MINFASLAPLMRVVFFKFFPFFNHW